MRRKEGREGRRCGFGGEKTEEEERWGQVEGSGIG